MPNVCSIDLWSQLCFLIVISPQHLRLFIILISTVTNDHHNLYTHTTSEREKNTSVNRAHPSPITSVKHPIGSRVGLNGYPRLADRRQFQNSAGPDFGARVTATRVGGRGTRFADGAHRCPMRAGEQGPPSPVLSGYFCSRSLFLFSFRVSAWPTCPNSL